MSIQSDTCMKKHTIIPLKHSNITRYVTFSITVKVSEYFFNI